MRRSRCLILGRNCGVGNYIELGDAMQDFLHGEDEIVNVSQRFAASTPGAFGA